VFEYFITDMHLYL